MGALSSKVISRRGKEIIRKLSLLVIITTIIFGWGLNLGLAQEGTELKISQLKVGVWPEYDEPKVMVTYDGKFADQATFPTKVNFLIPKDAEDIHACVISEQGQHECQAFEKDIKGEFADISYSVTRADFSVMSYYKPFKEEADKNFGFTFRSTYPTENLEINLQQPLKAANFKVEPTSSDVRSDDKGFKYYVYTFKNVSADKEFPFKISYTKTDPNPSVEKQEAGSATTPTSGGANPWIIALTIVGALLLAVGGYWIAVGRQAVPAQAGAKFSSGKGKKKLGIRFCPNCGSQVRYADSFCPNCGRKVKR